MATDTTTVRVRRPDSERLQAIAADRHTTVIDVVHEAVNALERQQFLRGLNEDYARLRQDPNLWRQYRRELAEWNDLG